jgi:hypothetical protein
MQLGSKAAKRGIPKLQSNRWLVNLARRLFLSFGTLVAVLAVSPAGWTENLGAWTRLLIKFQGLLLGLLVLILIVQLFLARQPFLSRLEYMAPAEYQGVPHMLPQGIESKIVSVLDEVGDTHSEAEHIVRINVLTGGATLHYLDQVIDRYATRSNWDIRILIADPDSPLIESLGDGAREQITASCARLAAIKDKIISKRRPARISWRSFTVLPMVRGFTIDEDHLFFGYFVWRRDGNKGRWRLCEQNTRLLHARHGDQLSRDCIEFYVSWFDHEWARGKNPEKTGAPTG